MRKMCCDSLSIGMSSICGHAALAYPIDEMIECNGLATNGALLSSLSTSGGQTLTFIDAIYVDEGGEAVETFEVGSPLLTNAVPASGSTTFEGGFAAAVDGPSDELTVLLLHPVSSPAFDAADIESVCVLGSPTTSQSKQVLTISLVNASHVPVDVQEIQGNRSTPAIDRFHTDGSVAGFAYSGAPISGFHVALEDVLSPTGAVCFRIENLSIQTVPEPSTLVLCGAGLAGFASEVSPRRSKCRARRVSRRSCCGGSTRSSGNWGGAMREVVERLSEASRHICCVADSSISRK